MCFSKFSEVGSTSRRLVNMWDTLLQSRMLDNTEFLDKLCSAEAALPELFKALNLINLEGFYEYCHFRETVCR